MSAPDAVSINVDSSEIRVTDEFFWNSLNAIYQALFRKTNMTGHPDARLWCIYQC